MDGMINERVNGCMEGRTDKRIKSEGWMDG